MDTTGLPTLLVLAAGMGSRYGGLKQVDAIGPGGEAILDYSVFDAIRAGFGRIVFVIRRDLETQFRGGVGARFERRIPVDYVFQEIEALPSGFDAPAGRTKPWGTAQAVLMAADRIDGPFAVINADDFYGAESYRRLAQHFRSGSAADAMVGFVLRRTLSRFGAVARGVCRVAADDVLEEVVEMTHLEVDGTGVQNRDAEGRVTRLTGDELVSMNMWGFHREIFGLLERYFRRFLEEHGTEIAPECYLPGAVNEFVRSRTARVRVLRTSETWFGVTYRDDQALVRENIERLIREGIYPENLWS